MYNRLISKNLKYFGRDGVIMYSKLCDYYNINQISLEDIKMFYNLLKSKEPLPHQVHRRLYLSCCLYYLSKKEPEYRTIFNKEFILNLSRKEEVNDTNLFLIYNIIEFDIRYLHSNSKNVKFLLDILEKFTNHKKTIENYLLFKYYRGILKYLLGQIDGAYTEYLEIIIGIEEYVKNKTRYIEFIRLKNNLFKIQLDLSKYIKEEYFEQYCFIKELYDRVKNENKKLGIKLGFCLYKILCRQNKFNECIPLLMEMKNILKNESLTGKKSLISIDYYLAIEVRIGYIGILIGNQSVTEYAIKKLKKILDIVQSNKQNKKLTLIYNAYSFIISILNINLGNYEKKYKEKAINFRNSFFQNKPEQKVNNYFITLNNREEIIINLYALNNMDYNISIEANTIMKKIIDITLNKKLLFPNQFLVFIISNHNNINRLSESYCTDCSKNKRKEYIKAINYYYNITFNYAKSVIYKEPLLDTDFIKSLLIEINASCAHANLFNNSIDMGKNIIKFFDDFSKKVCIKESTPSYELIYKIKGDYWFKNRDYAASINYYQKVINKMKDNDPKKPIIYFNIGTAYYFNKNRKRAVEYLNQCIRAFRVFDNEKKTFNVITRKEIIAKKVKVAKYLINNIGMI